MRLTLPMAILLLALMKENLGNLFFDPGFDSYHLTHQGIDSQLIPFWFKNPINDYSKDYNGASHTILFEVK